METSERRGDGIVLAVVMGLWLVLAGCGDDGDRVLGAAPGTATTVRPGAGSTPGSTAPGPTATSTAPATTSTALPPMVVPDDLVPTEPPTERSTWEELGAEARRRGLTVFELTDRFRVLIDEGADLDHDLLVEWRSVCGCAYHDDWAVEAVVAVRGGEVTSGSIVSSEGAAPELDLRLLTFRRMAEYFTGPHPYPMDGVCIPDDRGLLRRCTLASFQGRLPVESVLVAAVAER